MFLLFGQHQQVFVRTGRSDVTTVTNVWIDLINVMGGDTALMVAMNGVVVCGYVMMECIVMYRWFFNSSFFNCT